LLMSYSSHSCSATPASAYIRRLPQVRCDITYYTAINPLRRRRRLSHQTQGDIAKERLLFIHSCWQSCW
jgi:hypothetical protein